MELQTMPLRFRVWDKKRKDFIENEEWAKRHLVIKPDGKVCEATAYTEYGGTQSECTIIEYEDMSDDVIVSQDTGLKDKDRNRIFTGDIIETIDDKYEVFWGLYSAQCGAGSINDKECHPLYLVAANSKVVGNIWQNPELLEENK